MAVRDIIQAAGGSAATSSAVYVEDVFSTYLYTGTGASQTITNGIDLSTKGGLVWVKQRSPNTYDHCLFDTARGINLALRTNVTAGNQDQASAGGGVTAFNTDGYSLGTYSRVNGSTNTFASWTFRKQAKFFDTVTYTGTGSARTISHALGSSVGLVIVKRTDTTGGWKVYHSGLTSASYYCDLGATTAQTSDSTVWNSTAPTSSVFSVGTHVDVNASGGSYVAYLFAASSSGGFGAAGTDSVISCGSFSLGAGGNTAVTLGWEPQYLLIKKSNGVQDWFVFDTMRGWANSTASDYGLSPNVSATESSAAFDVGHPTATGFNITGLVGDYIYLAIRRGPMKTPTDATKVFSLNANYQMPGGTEMTVGFAADLVGTGYRDGGLSYQLDDRLRGLANTDTSSSGKPLDTASSSGEYSNFPNAYNIWNNIARLGANRAGAKNIYHFFRRAPGFFDVVCYTGTGANTTVAHNLGVAPEMVIVKQRNTTGHWATYHIGLTSASNYILLSTTAAQSTLATVWNSTAPTSTVFSVGTNGAVNTSAGTYVAYLFATCAGVSKCGSYTGSGATKQIDCGFTSGARFVLIKRTDSTGDWYVWDTARGIISANDPYILLNSAAAEVTTTDYIDPYSAGFEISSSAPAAINASGGTYIYLAIA